MKTTVSIMDLMDELDLEELAVGLDPAPVSAEQVIDDLTRRGALTAGCRSKKRRTLRLAVRIAVAAALVLALSVTAWAVGNYTDFFGSVFGDKGLDSRESEKLPEPIQGSDVMPAQHFETADPDAAEAALGGYVTEVGRSVSAGGCTLTVENCLIDENGVGAMAYTVACPDGVPPINTFDDMLPIGQYTAAGNSGGFVVIVKTASGLYLDHYDILNAAETTDTVLHGVHYFMPLGTAPGEGLSPDDTLLVTLSAWGADGVKQQAPDAIEISAAERISSVDLTCDGRTARLSSLGLVISPPALPEAEWNAMDENDRNDHSTSALWDGASVTGMVVHYDDGSEYVVLRHDQQAAEQNTISGGINGYTGAYMTIFNRFVDPAAVADVTVSCSDGARYVFAPAA